MIKIVKFCEFSNFIKKSKLFALADKTVIYHSMYITYNHNIMSK